MRKTIFITLTLIMICGGCGMAALSHYITPTDIDKASVKYVIETGAAEPEEFNGYPNLVKAQKLGKAVDAGHNIKQLDLQQQMQQDNLVYSIHKDVVSTNVTAGLQREEALFGSEGLLSMGLAMAGMGGFTGLLGLMRKRPGDITPEEATVAIADATGKSQEEVSAKVTQLGQVVKGVDTFIKTYKEKSKSDEAVMIADMLLEMKNIFNAAQDTKTQIAVSAVKKS